MALQLKAPKRRPSIVARSEQHGWLMTKLDIYKPAGFWIHPGLLLLRLLQSSILALFRQQYMLAACSSFVAIIGVGLVQGGFEKNNGGQTVTGFPIYNPVLSP
jgi:hypothetical protein